MTDPLEPNDLSHLTDKEFWALCPQGEHAPGPEPLSPAAWAVMSAASVAKDHAGCPIAAALRAAALACKRDTLILLSLADELEGVNA